MVYPKTATRQPNVRQPQLSTNHSKIKAKLYGRIPGKEKNNRIISSNLANAKAKEKNTQHQNENKLNSSYEAKIIS